MASLDKRDKGYYRIRWYEDGELKSKTFRADSYKDALDVKKQKEDEQLRMKSSNLRLSELWRLYKQARPRRNNEKCDTSEPAGQNSLNYMGQYGGSAMNKEVKDILNQRRKLMVLEYAKAIGSVSQTCQDLGIARSSFYEWKNAFEQEGKSGLLRKKPIPKNHPRKIKQSVNDKIIYLRKTYQLGAKRITYYLERYHGIVVSESSVTRTLVKYKINRLPKTASKRALHTRRYSKETPGHHVQVDVKFITLKDANGNKIKRFQYTAIDDATRIRALKIYRQHTQKNALEFIDYVENKFPFRIHTIRTDRGHEFQARFHWHVEDKGIRHTYIKPRSPQLNGKVERSHGIDQQEFYQLLTYTDDVDLNKKLERWEQFYNFDRPHGAFEGKTPYETLRSLLT